MRKTKLLLITLPLVTSLGACSWIDNYDRREKYLEAETRAVTEIPNELDTPTFVDELPVPEVDDARGISGQKVDVSLPPALSTTFGVEQIVYKKLGDTRWIFLDSPPAMVWPKLTKFLDEHNFRIQNADPRRGIIETNWLISKSGAPEEMYKSLISGTAWTDSNADLQSKFRVTIEPGIRSGSSEVYLEQAEVSLNAPLQPTTINWDGKSDNEALENEILTKLAYYLGEKVNEYVVSLGPTALYAEKAVLVPDAEKPELRYRLSFDRTWATIEGALDNARIQVEDLNRTDAVFYVLYNENIGESPGFFSGLFGGKDESSNFDKMQLQLSETSNEVVVTVMDESGVPAPADKAERLLKVIKESST